MKILAIGAHPDDIEIGCGGTLAHHVKAGHDVYLLVMTEGHMGGHGETRKLEQEAAARILNPKELFWGGYLDTELFPNMNQLVHDIETIIKKICPDLIFVNYEEDTHQDHRALTKAAVSATRYVKNVLFYEGPTTQQFSPVVFVDINETMEDKIAMLLAHHSQVTKTNIEGLSIADIARSTAVFRGIQGRVHYAEGFIPLRYFIRMRKRL
ncbi:MAG: N-acetyl-alpha-D-glucosaminyl L-malate deacetylase 1 [Syntrophus sp. SKADARSKE-3]|nr:N-acetyl-alpha-D-glucosaminyl L-malate deacetylase 1 [Syntrophus sp. SKADARSKE-3]